MTWILSFLTGAAAALVEELLARGSGYDHPAPRAGLGERPGWEGERLARGSLGALRGSAFLYEPLNFRQAWSLRHGGSRQAGVLALEGLWPSPQAPSTPTHAQTMPLRGEENCEGEARGLKARSGDSEKRKIFIK